MNSDDHARQPEAPFDPDARRRQIEEMERQFRERAARSGGGPVVTGDVNQRVDGEMEEFFAESEAHLHQVVPGLDEGPEGGLSETTGEIREKLEQFFTQVNEAAPASAAAAASDLHQRQKRWAGMESQPGDQEPDRRRPFSPSSGAGGADKMDLKTALERLKRHGVVKSETAEVAAPPAGTPAGVPRPVDAPPIPTRSEIALTHEVRLPPLARPGSPLPGRVRGVPQAAARPAAAPRAPAPQAPTRSAPPPPAGFSARPATRQVVPAPRALQPRAPQPRPPAPEPAPDTAPVLKPLPTTEINRPRRAAPVIPPAAPSQPASPSLTGSRAGDGGAGEFDEIFSEVEDLVIATLRESTQALQLPPPLPGQPTPPPAPAPAARRQQAVQEAPQQAPPAAVRARPAPGGPRTLSQVLPPPREEEHDEMEPEEEAPVAPHDWGVKTSSGPPGGWMLSTDIVPPTQAIEPGALRPAPAAPPRLTANTPPEMPEQPAAPPAAPESAPAAPQGDGGGGGARQIIMKKLKQQAQDFEPVVKALREKNILSEEDVRGEEPSGSLEDSDEVSIDSFRDRPRGEEASLTPMQMVEEIRRLRRIQEALIRKGVLSDDDIEQTLSDD